MSKSKQITSKPNNNKHREKLFKTIKTKVYPALEAGAKVAAVLGAAKVAHSVYKRATKRQPPKHLGQLDAINQGKYYAASLLYPAQLPGCKVPDIKMYRTDAKTSRTHVVVASVQGTGTDTSYLTNVVVFPTMGTVLTQGTTFVNGLQTVGVSTADTMNTFAGSNWISKRLVSMEMVVRNATNALTMQGRWAGLRLPFGSVISGTFSALESYNEASVGNFEPVAGKDTFRMVWFPAGTSDLAFTSPATGSASDNTVIQFMVTSTSAQILEVDITANWEAKILLASEAGITPTSSMGSESAASEALSVAAMHPALSDTSASRSSASIWDVINKIAPLAMEYVPIVGPAFSMVGSWVASLFGKHTDRILAFSSTLSVETIKDLEQNEQYLPEGFLGAVKVLAGAHVRLSDCAVSWCEKGKTIVIRKQQGDHLEFEETKVGFVRSGGSSCPNCPPEFCVPADAVTRLSKRLDALEGPNLCVSEDEDDWKKGSDTPRPRCSDPGRGPRFREIR